jgi:hypothetical protein
MKKKITFFGLVGILMFMTIKTSAQVGINAINGPADPSAGLDVKFTNKGFLLPRMTLEQRNAIASPANGLMVICTDCGTIGAICIYLSGNWVSVTLCNPPNPAAGTHVPSESQIIWNWNAAPNATGYKWNTTNNYNTATDMGTNTSKTETGLTGGSNYTRYIWAYNTCGVSAATTLNQLLFFPGMSYLGGKFFYFYQPGDLGYVAGELHGLIAAPSDQSNSAGWGCDENLLGGTSTAIGSGPANTTLIVNGCSSIENPHAAQVCADLVLNGYSDWFLPSKDELNQLSLQAVAVGGFQQGLNYWSSSEYDATHAWSVSMYGGEWITFAKVQWPWNITMDGTRAVRAF